MAGRTCGVSALRVVAWVVLLLLVAAAPGCKKRPRPKGLPAQAGLTGGKILFEDDFSKGAGNWELTSSNWKVVDGRLYTGDKPNDNKGAWLKEPALPADVRIEFTATSVKGNNPAFEGDIKSEFGGTNRAHASGYIVIFGGWKNTLNTIARGDEHGEGRLAVDAARRVEEGRTYRFALVRIGREIKWYLDGELLLSVKDEAPATGGDFGFNNWNSRVYFDNVKVYSL